MIEPQVRKQNLVRKLDGVLRRVNENVSNATDQSSLYSRGLATEGYDGGYAQCLRDVILFITSGATPSTRGYWRDR